MSEGAAPSAPTIAAPRARPAALWTAGTTGLAAFALTVAGTSLWIMSGDDAPVVLRVVLIGCAFGGFGALFAPRIRAALTLRRVVVGTAALLLVAVAMPETGSRDIWSYTMYGRMVSQHHDSPYTHTPADYPGDPLGSEVSQLWMHTPSVYGPAFVAVAAAGTSVTGSSTLLNRLFFQIIEAMAVLAALLLLWRRTRDPVALAFVGLNPAIISVVSGGHIDLLVGVAILGATLLVADRRPGWAGVTLAAAALMKLVAILPVAALAVWAWRRGNKRDAVIVAGTAGALTMAAYGVAGGQAALQPLLTARALISRASIWNPVHWLTLRFGAHDPSAAEQLGTAAAVVSALLVLAFVVVWVRRGDSPALASGGAILVFLLATAYALPWYAAWGLPVVALVWRSRLARLAALNAAILAVAYA